MKRLPVLITGLLIAPYAIASDFTSLAVALLALFLAVVNLFLGIKALSVAAHSGFKASLGYLVGAAFLALIAFALIADEAGHMSDTDVLGLRAIVSAPVILFAVLAAIFGSRTTSSSDEEGT